MKIKSSHSSKNHPYILYSNFKEHSAHLSIFNTNTEFYNNTVRGTMSYLFMQIHTHHCNSTISYWNQCCQNTNLLQPHLSTLKISSFHLTFKFMKFLIFIIFWKIALHYEDTSICQCFIHVYWLYFKLANFSWSKMIVLNCKNRPIWQF